MARASLNPEFWRGRRVLLTGHTGFKGSWLALWLARMGAEVTGFSLPQSSEPSLFDQASVAGDVDHRDGDVRDPAALAAVLGACDAEIVFHLAAQSLVRRSYRDPVETFGTNVMGTVNLLEAVRRHGGVRAVVIVTTDKCYENRSWPWGYREIDSLGGHDPYSSSKACAELVTQAYRLSYFQQQGTGTAAIASARAGNVIGGGDWNEDRLIPDAVRAWMADQPVYLRNPDAIRPWQHVLDPLAGYLMLAERLCADGALVADAWNFGPAPESEVAVRNVVDALAACWPGSKGWDLATGSQPHEARTLMLDCSKARQSLGWHPELELDTALRLTADWYRAYAGGEDMRAVTLDQLDRFLRLGSGTGGDIFSRIDNSFSLQSGTAS